MSLHFWGVLCDIVAPVVNGVVDELEHEEAMDALLLAVDGLNSPKPFEVGVVETQIKGTHVGCVNFVVGVDQILKVFALSPCILV